MFALQIVPGNQRTLADYYKTRASEAMESAVEAPSPSMRHALLRLADAWNEGAEIELWKLFGIRRGSS
jgi:hypothetical protein